MQTKNTRTYSRIKSPSTSHLRARSSAADTDPEKRLACFVAHSTQGGSPLKRTAIQMPRSRQPKRIVMRPGAILAEEGFPQWVRCSPVGTRWPVGRFDRAGGDRAPPAQGGCWSSAGGRNLTTAHVRAARASSGVQMLILRVSGIKNRQSTNATAGTTIGYTSAHPTLPEDR